jgi:hypothetical protein
VLSSIRTGLWRTGPELFSHMRQKSTGLDQYMCGKGRQDKEIQGTLKFEEGSLMVWGCMGWNGAGILAEEEDRMDADQYVSILEDNLLLSMGNSEFSEERIIFQ